MEYVLSIIGLPQANLKTFFAPLGNFGAHIYDHFIPHSRNNYHPHILGHRALALFSGLLVSVKIFVIAVLAFGPVAPAFSSAINIANIISLTNESRQQYSLSTLKENSLLDNAAQTKANDMLAKGYFSHTTPDGRTPWSFIVASGYNYLMAGENLAVNFTEAENVETAWMNSPGHKANILNKNYQEIGIGISQGQYQGHEAIFVVQMFGVPAEQNIALSDKPSQVQTTEVPTPVATQPQVTAPVQARGGEPQTLAAKQNKSEVTPVTVVTGKTTLSGKNIIITAETNGPVTKVVAYFGEQAIMLMPTSVNSWSGQAVVSTLAEANASVRIKAFGMDGQSNQIQLADFAPNTMENYNLSGTTPQSYFTFWGHTFNPNSLAGKFYLLFIAGLLASLILAIAIKRHIQHLPLIANTSFVIILACLFWMGG